MKKRDSPVSEVFMYFQMLQMQIAAVKEQSNTGFNCQITLLDLSYS